eukprot:EG_transcript_9407
MAEAVPHFDCRFTEQALMQPATLRGVPTAAAATLFFCPATGRLYSLTAERSDLGLQLWALPLDAWQRGWKPMEMRGPHPRRYSFVEEHSFCILGASLYTIQCDRGQCALYSLRLGPDPAAQWVSLPVFGLSGTPVCYCPVPGARLYFQTETQHGCIDVQTGEATFFRTPAPELSNDGALVEDEAYCSVPNGIARFDPAQETWNPVFTFALDGQDFLWLDYRGSLYVLSFATCSVQFLFRFHLRTRTMEYVRCRDAIVMPPCVLDFWLCFAHGPLFYLLYGLGSLLCFNPEHHVVTYTPALLRFRPFLNATLFSDMQFVVQGQPIPAHRVVVAASPVLRAFLERAGPTDAPPVVAVEDASPTAFEAVLAFLYTGTLPPVSDPAAHLEVFYLANQYCLPELTALAEMALLARFRQVVADGSGGPPPPPFARLLPYLVAAYLVHEGGALFAAGVQAVVRGFLEYMHDPEFHSPRPSTGPVWCLCGLEKNPLKKPCPLFRPGVT